MAQTGPVPQPVGGGLSVLAPSHNVVLTVQGPQGAKTWTLQQIEALGMRRVKTATFWPDDDGVYEGPLLADVLKASGLDTAEFVRVVALDGFSQKLPRQDWSQWPVLLATRKDGVLMETRQKGPLRVIYPRDMSPELSKSLYRLRWVWLVTQIDTQGK